MRLFTVSEAADILSEGLGRQVKRRNLENAVKAGRIRGRQSTEGRGHLIPVDEIVRILEENRDSVHPFLEAWDMIPANGFDLLWRPGWGKRRRKRLPADRDRLAELIERLREME
jgi:hypothetical protein